MANGTIRKEKELVTVWTNANSNADFASQTLSIDLSGYKEFVIRFASMKSATPDTVDNYDFRVTSKDVVYLGHGWSGAFVRARSFKVSDTGVLFGSGTYLTAYGSGTWSTNNANFVPIRIQAR